MRNTFATRWESARSFTGFDYLRIGLAAAICCWHSWWVYTGTMAWDLPIWRGWLRVVPEALVPMFFALSGFLVAGSLERNRLHHFLLLRAMRIMPALAFEVIVSACVIGPAFTDLPLTDYIASKKFLHYFLNIVGWIHVTLPGVFSSNPLRGLMNPQLWTIPFELECYAAIALLSVVGIARETLRGIVVMIVVIGAGAAGWGHSGSVDGHLPGRILVVSFLAGFALHSLRAHVPDNPFMAVVALAASAVCLHEPRLHEFSALPVAYATAWLGLRQPPAIPFGDLSYGVYLFHFPMTQTVLAMGAGRPSPWWLFAPISLIASALSAAASWNLIEKPVLARKRAILMRVDALLVRWDDRRRGYLGPFRRG